MTKMRVIAGQQKGRSLVTGGAKGLRPTSDRIRKSLFDILGRQVEGCTFLDLFAGTGSVGIEALSRGARSATFVEIARRAVKGLKENLMRLRLFGQSEVLVGDARNWVRRLAQRDAAFDIVFLDPPYRTDLARQVLALLGSQPGCVRRDGWVIVQHLNKEEFADQFGSLRLFERRRIGEHCLSFYRNGDEREKQGTGGEDPEG